MAKKTSISASDMEALFGHALVQPKAKTGEGQAETRAAESLGVQVLGSAQTSPALRTWRARGADGEPVALVTLADGVTPAERERVAKALTAFHAAAELLPGTLPVRELTPERDAFLTDLWTTGSARDLSALRWPLRKRLEFVADVARAVGKLHAAGLTHGCLCADNVLLDDDLRPVLSEAGLVDVRALIARHDAAGYEAFAAPELRAGAEPTPGADAYAIGRLLQELTAGDEKLPATVAEVVHRCVSPPQSRFASTDAIVTALQAAASALAPTEDAPREPRNSVVAERRERPTAAPPPEAAEAPMPSHASFQLPEAPAWVGVCGLVLVAGALGVGAVVGGGNATLRTLLQVLVPLGAALATLLAPPLSRGRAAARITLALGLAAVAYVVDPLALSFRMAAQRHIEGGPDAQRKAVDEIVRLGRDFRGLSLAGANLEEVDLTGALLLGVDLTGANLRGAKLDAAEVDGAKFGGATLAGADLSSTQLQLAMTSTALCDEHTRFPPGFTCDSGLVVRNQKPLPP
jgi:hypothetical protein